MRIGIITAMYEEMLPIYKEYGKNMKMEECTISNIKIIKIEDINNKIYLVKSGIGEIRAAIATQVLLSHFDVEIILNFGFVGAISNKVRLNDLVIVEKAVHYQFDLSAINNIPKGQYNNRHGIYFNLDNELIGKIYEKTLESFKKVTLASGDEFIASKKRKEELNKTFGADICDMELAGIAMVCEMNDIPLASLKIVSDNADQEANQTFEETVEKGTTKYEKYISKIIEASEEFFKHLAPKLKNREN